MVDAVHNEMQVSSYFIVRQMFFTVENKTMNQVLSQTESEYTQK